MSRYKYPKGCHPNSLKALEEHGKKTRFTSKQSKEAAEKSALLRKILKDAVDQAYSITGPEEWEALTTKAAKALIDAAMAGDTYALKILMRRMH